jgi:hypothetical protein
MNRPLTSLPSAERTATEAAIPLKPIRETVERLDKGLGALFETLNRLEVELKPILELQEPRTESPDCKPERFSLNNCLSEFAARIVDAENVVNSIINRLEL